MEESRTAECLFCRIVRGELPAAFVWESDAVVAFRDVSPQAPVHVLIVPRGHYVNLSDDVPSAVLSALLAAVPEVARVTGVLESGYRVIVNNGRDANQTVGHLHVHVLGGQPMSHGMVKFTGG